MPRECLKIIESKSKVRQSRSKAIVSKVSTSSSTPAVSSDVAELKDMVRALILDKKNKTANSLKKTVRKTSTTASTFSRELSPGSTVTTRKEDLKGITTRSSVAYQGPTSSSSLKVMNCDTEVTKDTMLPTNNGSTEDVQPPVIQVQSQNPTSEPDDDPMLRCLTNEQQFPFPSERNDERRQ
ncbi:hypothetical protein Tco_0151363 [Tanacetum coccineum]